MSDVEEHDGFALDDLFIPEETPQPTAEHHAASTRQSHFNDLPDDIMVLILLKLNKPSLGSVYLTNSQHHAFVKKQAAYWFLSHYGRGSALLHLIGYGGSLLTPRTIDELLSMGAILSRQLCQTLHARYTSSCAKSDSSFLAIPKTYGKWGRSSTVPFQAYAHILTIANQRWGTTDFSSNDSVILSNAIDRRMVYWLKRSGPSTEIDPEQKKQGEDALEEVLKIMQEYQWGLGYPASTLAVKQLTSLATQEQDIRFFKAIEGITFPVRDVVTIVYERMLRHTSNTAEMLADLDLLQAHLSYKEKKGSPFLKDVLARFFRTLPVSPALLNVIKHLREQELLPFDLKTWMDEENHSPMLHTNDEQLWMRDLSLTFPRILETRHCLYLVALLLHQTQLGIWSSVPSSLNPITTISPPALLGGVLADVHFSQDPERVRLLFNHLQRNVDNAKILSVYRLAIHMLLKRPDTGKIIKNLLHEPALQGKGREMLRTALIERRPDKRVILPSHHSLVYTPLGATQPCLYPMNLRWLSPQLTCSDMDIECSIAQYRREDDPFEFAQAAELGDTLYGLFDNDPEVLEILFQHAILSAAPSRIMKRFFVRGLHLTGEHLDLLAEVRCMSLQLDLLQDAYEAPYVEVRTKENCRPRKRNSEEISTKERLQNMQDWREAITACLARIEARRSDSNKSFASGLGVMPTRSEFEYSLRLRLIDLDRSYDCQALLNKAQAAREIEQERVDAQSSKR